jgi:hypothetical protein
MPFNGNEGTMMDITDAGALTAAFRTKCPAQPKGYFFGINNLNDILSQTGCMGIRIYFGWTTTNEFTMVLVGADCNENDQVASGDNILDAGVPCPTACSQPDGLNS